MRDERKAGAAAAAYMSNFVNCFGGREKYEQFIQELCNDHRTLQASMVRLIIDYLRAMAKNGTDERNEAAVKAAQIMVKALDDAGAAQIPFI